MKKIIEYSNNIHSYSFGKNNCFLVRFLLSSYFIKRYLLGRSSSLAGRSSFLMDRSFTRYVGGIRSFSTSFFCHGALKNFWLEQMEDAEESDYI